MLPKNFLQNRFLIKNDFELVREEIRELKECQTKYVLVVTTIPSVILGIAFFSQSMILGVLIPLLIVLPIWCIFIDKSKSISRLQAFYMLLEKRHTDPKFIATYNGFENANNNYREMDRDLKKGKKVRGGFEIWNSLPFGRKWKFFKDIISLNKSSRYQTIVFSIFFYTSFLILSLSYYLFTRYSMLNENGYYFVLLAILLLIDVFAIACYEFFFSVSYKQLTVNEKYNRIVTGWDSKQRRIFMYIIAAITIFLSLLAIRYFYFTIFDSIINREYFADLIIIDIITILVLIVARYNLKISHGVIEGIYQNNAYLVIWEQIL